MYTVTVYCPDQVFAEFLIIDKLINQQLYKMYLPNLMKVKYYAIHTSCLCSMMLESKLFLSV